MRYDQGWYLRRHPTDRDEGGLIRPIVVLPWMGVAFYGGRVWDDTHGWAGSAVSLLVTFVLGVAANHLTRRKPGVRIVNHERGCSINRPWARGSERCDCGAEVTS